MDSDHSVDKYDEGKQSLKPMNFLGLVLIFTSSILLGIWAVKGTIALRNILLGVGALTSLLYCHYYFKSSQEKIPLKNYIPIIMLSLMFCWVIFHYFFLSRFPDIQLHELKSTWLRTFLASIVGFGAGLAILKKPNAVNFLWLGIFLSFAYLFYQYIPLAISTNNILYHAYDQFIYPGKISGVLAGTILIAGLLGTVLDRFASLSPRSKIVMALFWLIGTCSVLYASVYIFDARNGVGLAVMIFGFVSPLLFLRLAFSLLGSPNLKKVLLQSAFLATILIVVGGFTLHQFKLNSGWDSMVADTKIALQVHKYSNWQNPRVLGYPVNELGAPVKSNTYERIAWATAGITLIAPENPLGVGVLRKPFGILLNEKYPTSGNYIVSTHSAWVEMALSFGLPGLILTLGPLGVILIISTLAKSPSPFRWLPATLSLSAILLYGVGEISSQHSIEILGFLIAFLAACQFPVNHQISSSNGGFKP
jgi:hypothetical protein